MACIDNLFLIFIFISQIEIGLEWDNLFGAQYGKPEINQALSCSQVRVAVIAELNIRF